VVVGMDGGKRSCWGAQVNFGGVGNIKETLEH
jgi:hypothetical protein